MRAIEIGLLYFLRHQYFTELSQLVDTRTRSQKNLPNKFSELHDIKHVYLKPHMSFLLGYWTF